MSDQNSVVPVKNEKSTEAGQNPIGIMVKIAENENLSDADKSALIKYAQNRFTNRRRMAYIALYALILSLALLFLAAFIDGINCPAGKVCNGGILKSLESSQTLFICIEGFLTTIVAAYYGVSAWRPAS